MKPSQQNKKGKVPDRGRREFLMAGGVMMTTLSLGEAPPVLSRFEPSASQSKIRGIMERYGSELGRARFVS